MRMFRPILRALPCLALATGSLWAQPTPPTEIAITRTATFTQSVGASPVATGAAFVAAVGLSPVGLDWAVSPPFGSEDVIPPVDSAGLNRALRETYTDTFLFPLNRPGGAYRVRSFGSAVSEVYLEVGGPLAASASITNLAAGQDLVGGTDFTLTFTPPAGATAADVILLAIFNQDTGDLVYQSPRPLEPGVIIGTAISHTFTVPAGLNFTGRLTWLRLSHGEPEVPPFLASTRIWAGAGSEVAFLLRSSGLPDARAALQNFLAAAGVPVEQRQPLADPDGDGLSHLEEWFWGTDPTSAGASPIPLPTFEGANLVWLLDVPALAPGPTVEFLVQAPTANAPADLATSQIIAANEFRRVYRIEVSLESAPPNAFLTVRLSLPE